VCVKAADFLVGGFSFEVIVEANFSLGLDIDGGMKGRGMTDKCVIGSWVDFSTNRDKPGGYDG
jgi:hypothetical protein